MADTKFVLKRIPKPENGFQSPFTADITPNDGLYQGWVVVSHTAVEDAEGITLTMVITRG